MNYLLLALALVLLTRCTGLPTSVSPSSCEDMFTTVVEPNAARQTSQYTDPKLAPNAARLDAFLKGQLDAKAFAEWQNGCRQTKHLFCLNSRERRHLADFLKVQARIREAPPEKTITPLAPVMKNGKVTNWRALRRGSIPSLLAGLSPLKQDELKALGTEATKKQCPNAVVVAIAATLEDYLPDSSVRDFLPALYEKGARCAGSSPVDRENFRTRAALFQYWKRDFAAAAKLLERVRATDALSGRPLYWLYRAQLELKQPEKAALTLDRLKGRHPFSFHSLIASTTGKTEMLATPSATLFKPRSRRSSRMNRLIQQTEALREFSYGDSAMKLAAWALHEYPHTESEVRLYLASLSDPHTQMVTAPEILLSHAKLRARKTLELSYPKAFIASFQHQCDSAGLDPFLLLALARRESSFDYKAVSNANAQGLLQINPDTAKRLMGQNEVDLFNPDQNIALGAHYLQTLIQENGGKIPLALAAYNAGEEAVARWQKRIIVSDPVLFVDLIPYRETRDYVSGVLGNYFWYHKLYRSDVPDIFKDLAVNKP